MLWVNTTEESKGYQCQAMHFLACLQHPHGLFGCMNFGMTSACLFYPPRKTNIVLWLHFIILTWIFPYYSYDRMWDNFPQVLMITMRIKPTEYKCCGQISSYFCSELHFSIAWSSKHNLSALVICITTTKLRQNIHTADNSQTSVHNMKKLFQWKEFHFGKK